MCITSPLSLKTRIRSLVSAPSNALADVSVFAPGSFCKEWRELLEPHQLTPLFTKDPRQRTSRPTNAFELHREFGFCTLEQLQVCASALRS